MENKSGLTVTGDKVLVLPPKVSNMSSGGIELTEHVIQQEHIAQQVGILIDAGAEAWKSKELVGLKPGDTVTFPKYQFAEFKFDGVAYWILRANVILGKTDRLPDPKFNGAQSSLEVFGADDQAIAA